MFTFASDRIFEIISYEPNLGTLMFRSRLSNEHKTRITISFQDVIAIESRMFMKNLAIEEVEADFLTNINSNPKEIMEVGHKVYSLDFVGGSGFIVGGRVATHEISEYEVVKR